MGERDWVDWHGDYDDPTSGLAQRLRAVQKEVAAALDRAGPAPVRVVSMCAGQGRDLLGVLPDHPRRADVRARLVELDPRNASAASAAADAAGLDQVEVVVGDATVTTAYDGAVPADLVLVCGVFGHATDDDIRGIVVLLPSLCSPGATVIWTRGGFQHDIRPTIRGWFADAGFEEVAFLTGAGGSWGVGANRLVVPPSPYEPGVRLFTFLDELPGQNGAVAKYDALLRHLCCADDGPIEMTFDEIDGLVGGLPASAATWPGWWANDTAGSRHVQARAWLGAGREVESVDRAGKRVRFSAAEWRRGS